MVGRGHEIVLNSDFRKMARVYVGSFAHAYAAYGASAVEYLDKLQAYEQTISVNIEEIYRVAAAAIDKYLNMYGISTNKNADEFKIIYFMGRAIELWLKKSGFADVGRVHCFTMVGLLDYRLRRLDIPKPLLLKVMKKLIKDGVIDDELGPTGCYLAYKVVSTTGVGKPVAA